MAPGESSLKGLAFSLRVGNCNACENRRSLIECPAKKNAERCLTGKRGSVTKTVAAAGGLDKNPLDSGKIVFII